MPAILQDAISKGAVKLHITYESPLAKAQQHFKLSAIERVLALAGQTAQFGGLNAVNIDETVRLYAELLGAPQGMLFSPQELEARNQAQQEQIQQQQDALLAQSQAQTNQANAGATRDMAQAQNLQQQTQMAPEALAQLLGGAGGQ